MLSLEAPRLPVSISSSNINNHPDHHLLNNYHSLDLILLLSAEVLYSARIHKKTDLPSVSFGVDALMHALAQPHGQEQRLTCIFWTVRRYDTCILIDDSASMYDLWREAEAALSGIVDQVIKYDSDGLDVYFLNSTHSLQGAKDSGSIRELFQYVGPTGESTPTELRVCRALLLNASCHTPHFPFFGIRVSPKLTCFLCLPFGVFLLHTR